MLKAKSNPSVSIKNQDLFKIISDNCKQHYRLEKSHGNIQLSRTTGQKQVKKFRRSTQKQYSIEGTIIPIKKQDARTSVENEKIVNMVFSIRKLINIKIFKYMQTLVQKLSEPQACKKIDQSHITKVKYNYSQKRNNQSLFSLKFSLLTLKIVQLKAMFFSKLELIASQKPMKPYQITLTIILYKFIEARRVYLLETAFTSLK